MLYHGVTELIPKLSTIQYSVIESSEKLDLGGYQHPPSFQRKERSHALRNYKNIP